MKRQVNPVAADMGLYTCHSCGLVSYVDKIADGICPRCHAKTHRRKPDSIRSCWALLIAAYILYIPANLLPIMETGTLFSYRSDTIMSGVIHMWKTGSWGIAAVIFIASIIVPLFKLMALTLLLLSVQRNSVWWPMQRMRLYRLVELVGRWSMLDIYVVALLAALVQIKNLANVQAGSGALAFGAVVVLTMLASMKFDSRLIWDPLRDKHTGE